MKYIQYARIIADCALLQAQLGGLAPLVIPKRLLQSRGREDKGGATEGEGREPNQTDQEKTLAKDTANLLQVGPPETLASVKHHTLSLSLSLSLAVLHDI